MAWTAETYFEDRTPDHQRSWNNNGWLAPSATDVKAGTMVSLNTATEKLIEVVDDADETNFLGCLAVEVGNLDAGPVEGYRDLVTLDRDYSAVVPIIMGSRVTTLVLGAQNAVDTQAGYLQNITNADDLFLSADGGIDRVHTSAHRIGLALNAATFASDTKLSFIFDPEIIAFGT